MKRIFLSALLAVCAAASWGATLNPIQLLNPVGSTSGQAILSTGPTTSPAWGNVSIATLSGILPIANGGTGATTAAAALANLGAAALASPTFTGVPSSPTAAISTYTDQIATTKFVLNQASSTLPLINGTAAIGSSASFARADHVHPTDTTRAPLASPAFTGTATFAARPTFNGATPWDSANLASPAATTGNLSQFASTTSAQLATLLSDETGSGSAVFSLTPTLTAPNIVGTISGGNAAAGSVGEFINPAATTGTSITTSTATNCASTSLTAGDWDVQAMIGFTPAPTTTVSRFQAGVSTTSAALGSLGTYSSNPFAVLGSGPALNSYAVLPSPVVRVSISATTTVYAIGLSNFATSTMTCDGSIRARRIR